jgi:hypothetical protein
MPSERKIAHAKEKAREELRLTLVVFAFLAFMFCAFLTYRRLVLKEYGISYAHYGAGLIEAAIIAKVILFGQAMNLGKRIEDEPLIISVLVKSILYALFTALFTVLEDVVVGLLHRESWHAIAQQGLAGGPNEILGTTLMIMVAFIPFFAFWETGRVLGPGKLSEMFLHKRVPM